MLRLEEDNSAAKRVMDTGRNPTLRHLNRTHRVDLRSLHEQVNAGNMIVSQCPTNNMAADVLTKGFTNADKWKHACNLINHIRLADVAWSNPKHSLNAKATSGMQVPALPAAGSPNRVVIEF